MTAALGNRFADPAPVMPRRIVVVDGRRPPECSLQLPDRPADDAVAKLGLAAQPMRQGAQKRVPVGRQQRLAGGNHSAASMERELTQSGASEAGAERLSATLASIETGQ
jgi:hypothetical protein